MRLPTIVGKHKSEILMFLGLVAFILYLWLFVGIGSLLDLIGKLNAEQYSLYFSIAILALVLSVFFDSLIWHSLLRGLNVKLKLRKVILYNWIGNFVEMVIPCETVCGEATRIYLSTKETNENVGISAAPVITSRILSTFVYTGGLLIASAVLIATKRMSIFLLGTLLLVLIGTIGVIGAIIYLALTESAEERLVSLIMVLVKIVTKNPAKQEEQKEKLRLSLYSFGEAFRTYRKSPRLLVKPMIYAIIAWFFMLSVYLMVFFSLNFTSISLIDLAVVYCISSTVETLTAGFPVGAVEITMISVYAALGVPLVVAGAATTFTRLLTFWVQIIIGYPILQFTELKEVLKKGFSTTFYS